MASYPKEWDDEAAEAMAGMEMCLLKDDGDTVMIVPLTGPKVVADAKYKTERIFVAVARCGDSEVGEPDTWTLQELPMGKRVFRRYKSLRRQCIPDGFECRKILRIVRDGVKDSLDTKYHLSIAGDVPETGRGAITALQAEALDE